MWLERLNQSFLDRYSRIDTFAKRARAKAEEMGYESVLDLFDTSAHAMALMSDKAGGYLATSLRDGILTYRHGVPMVEEQGLVTSAPRREFDVETGKTVEREVVSVPGMYAEGATGGIFPILDALSTPGKNLLPELFLYMRALRGARLNHEGRETQLSGDTIEAGYQAARDNPEIVIAAQNIQNWNDGIVQFQIDTGVISKELGDVYRKYSDYIPFYIDLEGVRTEAIEGIILKELGRPDSEMFLAGGIANQRAHMKFSGLGKDQVISDPIESIVRNARAAITAGLKNVASQRAIRDALDIDQATEISSRQLANQGVAGKKNAVTIRIEGQDRHFVLKDPLFFEAMTGAFGGRNPYFEFLGMPARVLRGLVTRSPDYLIANMLRDSLHVYILNGGEATPIIDAAKTMASNISNMAKGVANPTYTTLQRLGAISGIEHAELTPARMTRQFARDSGTGSRVKNAFQSFWDQTGELSSRSESATRENVYESAYAHAIKKYKGMGFDRLDANGVNIAERKAMGEAAYQAVEVLNFSRHGSNPYMQFVAATVPFLNSRIQGLATMGRSIKGDSPTGRLNPQDAKISHLNRALAVSSVTVMYTILSEMDDDRDDLPDVVKENYWLAPVAGTNYYIGLPRPFEAGVMYANVPEMITRLLIGLMTDGMHGSTFKEFKDSLGHAVFSTLNLNPMPQAFKPAYEWMANKNSYTNNPIVPEWQKKMPGADQYGDGTTAQAMLLSRGVESVFGSRSSLVPSPRNIDNAMRTLFGGVGVYAIQALDNTLRWAVPGMPTRPAPQLSDIPVLKRFVRSKYGGGLKNDFYEIKNSIDGLVLAVKQSAESGEPERATRLAMENENLLAVRSAIGRIEKKLSAIRNGRSMDFRNNALTREREIMYDEAEGRALALVPELKRTLGNW